MGTTLEVEEEMMKRSKAREKSDHGSDAAYYYWKRSFLRTQNVVSLRQIVLSTNFSSIGATLISFFRSFVHLGKSSKSSFLVMSLMPEAGPVVSLVHFCLMI